VNARRSAASLNTWSSVAMRSGGSHPLESVATAAALMASMAKTTECRPWSITAGQSMSPQASSGHPQTSISTSYVHVRTRLPGRGYRVDHRPSRGARRQPHSRQTPQIECRALRRTRAPRQTQQQPTPCHLDDGQRHYTEEQFNGVRHGSGYGFKGITEQRCKTKLKLNRRYVRPRNRLHTHTHTQSRTQGTHPWSAAAQRLLRAGGT